MALGVPLAGLEDRQAERDADGADGQQRQQVVRLHALPSRIASRMPRSAYVAGLMVDSACIHCGITPTG